MNKTTIIFLVIACISCSVLALSLSGPTEEKTVAIDAVADAQKKPITVRTETFPRPPYSGATYYIYERDDKVICTKLTVCNKFEKCTNTYKKGVFKDELDVQTGDPYEKENPVLIAASKLKKHTCLTKFKLTQ